MTHIALDAIEYAFENRQPYDSSINYAKRAKVPAEGLSHPPPYPPVAHPPAQWNLAAPEERVRCTENTIESDVSCQRQRSAHEDTHRFAVAGRQKREEETAAVEATAAAKQTAAAY